MLVSALATLKRAFILFVMAHPFTTPFGLYHPQLQHSKEGGVVRGDGVGGGSGEWGLWMKGVEPNLFLTPAGKSLKVLKVQRGGDGQVHSSHSVSR